MSVRLALLVVGGLAVAGVIVGLALSSSEDELENLPPVEGTDAPTSYRIVYDVESVEVVTVEERVVHRPFQAYVASLDSDGDVLSERWSDLGLLTTRSSGSPAAQLTIPVAPAASDLRPDRYTEALLDAGRLRRGEETNVRGRACVRTREVTGEQPLLTTDPVTIERCVDSVGLVLEEIWFDGDGEVVRTLRARSVEVGDAVPPIEIPEAEPMPLDQGNGAVREIPADEPPPFAEVFDLANPAGFTFVGRYAVVPLSFGGAEGALSIDPDVALYTDVWTRGADVLMLDQGASRSGAVPFSDVTVIDELELELLGRGKVAVDLRSAAVRLVLDEGGFVRLSGTLPLDELLELAATITERQAVATA